jgi:hypothetical protein
MAQVFGILTAIVLALSAFVAFQNKEKYAAEISVTRVEHDKLEKSKIRLAAAQVIRKQLPIDLAAVNKEIDDQTADEAKQKKINSDLKEDVDAKTAKIATNKEQLDDIRTKTEKTGNIKELAAKLRATKAELAELATSIEDREKKLADLGAQIVSTDKQIADAKGKFDDFANNRSLPSLKTRIRSIYPNWGFVTLAAGNNAGVVANSNLQVVRDGKTIAMLLVSAVESTSASASIVPDSLANDVTLMVGDQVVPDQKIVNPAGN